MGSMRCLKLLLLAAVLIGSVTGCAKNPGEDYLDTSIEQLIAAEPGYFELHSTVQNPIGMPTMGPNFAVLRQGKHMIIAAGDSVEAWLPRFAGQNYSLIGRRMGQPKIWFAVDGIVQEEKLAMGITHELDKVFPSYEEYPPPDMGEYESVDLNEYDFDKERKIRRELLQKKIRIVGNLISNDLGDGVIQYLVESRNVLLELQPVGPNLRYFLEMASVEDTPFVGYGQLVEILAFDDGTDEDRGSSRIVGPFNVDVYRFGSDIAVRNVF